MADETAQLEVLVKISGESDAIKRFNSLIDKIRDGTASIDEMREAARFATKTFTSWGAENEILKKGMADTAVTIKEKVAVQMEALATKNTKTMKSYFSLGQEMRKWFIEQRAGDRIMRESGQTVSMLGNIMGASGLSGIINTAQGSFQQMQFAVVAAGKSMEQAGGTVAGMGKTLVGAAGGIAGLVAVLSLAALAFKASADAQKEFEEAIDAYNEAVINSGRLTEEEIEILRKRQLVSAQAKEVEVTWWKGIFGMQALYNDLLTKTIVKETDVEKKRKADEEAKWAVKKKQLDEDQQIRDIAWDIEQSKRQELAAWREINAEAKKNKEIALSTKGAGVQAALMNDPIIAGLAKYSKEQRELSSLSPAMRFGVQKREFDQSMALGTEGLKRVSVGESIDWSKKPREEQQKTFEEARSKASDFTLALADGFTSATDTLANGLSQAFSLGDSLLAQFANQMISTMMSVGAKAAVKGILGMIPGLGSFAQLLPFAAGGVITEPVVGVGLNTGRVHTFGERGQPEMVTPLNAVGQAGRLGSGGQGGGVVVLETRIKGNDIVLVHSKASQARKGRTM